MNYFIEIVIIPDECYYHIHEGGFLFNLFYELPSWNGGHPYPSTFNSSLTFVIGFLLGYIFQKPLKDKKLI